MYMGVMHPIAPICNPCTNLTNARTQILGIMIIKLRIIERKLIKLRHFLLEYLSTKNKVKIDPMAPVKLIIPVSTPYVVPL